MVDGPCPTCGTYHNPALTVDAVSVRGEGERREVLLIRRGREPWKGFWVFPGGFVDGGEDPEDAVIRELREECNLVGEVTNIISVRGNPNRDPRGHVVTIFYSVNVISDEIPIAGDDAAHAEWILLESVELENMGADHAEIIQLLKQNS